MTYRHISDVRQTACQTAGVRLSGSHNIFEKQSSAKVIASTDKNIIDVIQLRVRMFSGESFLTKISAKTYRIANANTAKIAAVIPQFSALTYLSFS